jgi:hypothetical protein
MLPGLDPGSVSVIGLRLGDSARAIPQGRIRSVDGSPLVQRSEGGTDLVSRYYGEGGRQIPIEQVIESVVDANGVIHVDPPGIGFAVTRGVITRFSLYGGFLGDHFQLRTYEAYLAAFGRGERVEESVTYGDTLGYTHWYAGGTKNVFWSVYDGVASVGLGAPVRIS